MPFSLARIDPSDTFSVWHRNFAVTLRLWRTEVVPPIVEPVVSIFAFGWGIGSLIAAQVMGVPYLTFVGAGILVFTGMLRAMFECTYGSYFRLVYQSTFDAILCTPVSAESLGIGEIAWATTKAGFDSLLILLVLFLFGILHSPWSLLIPLVILAGGMGVAATAFAFTSSIHSIHHYNYFFAAAFSVLWICGAYFPIDRLPRLLQMLAWAVPITSVVDLCRTLMTGHLGLKSALEVGWILVSGLLLGEIALRRFRKRMYD